MIYEISSDKLTAKINSFGAELISAVRDGIEFIWNGDEKWWNNKAPMLFPICGRLPEKKYSYGGKVYDMGIHGFAAKSEFCATRIEKSLLELTLKSSELTRSEYPFEFIFTVTYSVEGEKLKMNIKVENIGSDVMPYMVGWHPGFNLFGEGEINNFRLKFNAGDELLLHPILPGCFVQQVGEKYAAPGGTYVLNEEEIYTNDTVIFSMTGGRAVLSSPDTERRIEMTYSDNLPYFCIWKETDARARFVCLEPWSDIPDAGIAPVAFETRPMSRLEGGKSTEYVYSVSFY